MGNRRLYKTEWLHTLGALGSERLMVTAQNLFHPTASFLFQEIRFFMLRASLNGKGEEVY